MRNWTSAQILFFIVWVIIIFFSIFFILRARVRRRRLVNNIERFKAIPKAPQWKFDKVNTSVTGKHRFTGKGRPLFNVGDRVNVTGTVLGVGIFNFSGVVESIGVDPVVIAGEVDWFVFIQEDKNSTLNLIINGNASGTITKKYVASA